MSRLVFACASSLLLTSSALALADDQPAPPPDPNAPPATAPAPAADTGGWPLQIQDRPFTLNKGMVDGHLSLSIANIVTTVTTGTPPVTTTKSDTGVALGFGASYGVSDQVEVGADYAIQFAPDFAADQGPLVAHLAYRAAHDAKMDLAAYANFTFLNVGDGFYILGLGANFRYKVAPKIGIITPAPQLAIGLNSPQPIALALPVGVDLAAAPNIYAALTTNIGTIAIKDAGDSAFIFDKVIPINLTAFYSMPKIDIGVGISDDLKNAGDTYAITLIARLFKI